MVGLRQARLAEAVSFKRGPRGPFLSGRLVETTHLSNPIGGLSRYRPVTRQNPYRNSPRQFCFEFTDMPMLAANLAGSIPATHQ